LIVGGVVAAVFGFIVGLPALRLRGDYLAIVTLAFGEIVRNICNNMPFLGGAQGLASLYYKESLTSAGKMFPMFIPTFICVLFMLAIIQNLVRSKHGRAITAIRDNEIAAKSMGVNVTYYKLFAFIVSAFFAGIAGVIYGAANSPVQQSFFSYNYSIEILVMVVLGGMGSINGSIFAATLITCINFILKDYFSGDMAAVKNLVYALILILIVIYKNAPALRSFREKFNLSVLLSGVKAKFIKDKAAHIEDDATEWDRIPTKIITDEILSTDLHLDDYTPDKPDKGGN
jgi:branched-chain amino acid transport system permease protein